MATETRIGELIIEALSTQPLPASQLTKAVMEAFAGDDDAPTSTEIKDEIWRLVENRDLSWTADRRIEPTARTLAATA